MSRKGAGLCEGFATAIIIDEEKDESERSWFEGDGFFFVLIFIKLVFIYIVMLLWPRVMPKIFPGITKQPTYINLLGLAVILALL